MSIKISLFTVLAGTFLGGMARPALEGLLTAGEAVPFVGEVCKRERERVLLTTYWSESTLCFG